MAELMQQQSVRGPRSGRPGNTGTGGDDRGARWDSPAMPVRYTKAQAGVRKIHEHSRQARLHQAGERRTLAPGPGYVRDPEGDPGERVRRDRSGHGHSHQDKRGQVRPELMGKAQARTRSS